MRIGSPFRRTCPPELEQIIELLNELPRSETKVQEFLDRYKEAMTSEHFFDRFKNSRVIAQIGLWDNMDDPSEHLQDLLADRGRFLFLISTFNTKVSEMSDHPRMRSIQLERLTFRFGDSKLRFGFSDQGHLIVRRGPALSFLMENNALSLLERIKICPICEDVKWLQKSSRSDTCGNRNCVDRLAYIRKKHRVGKILNDDEQRIIDEVGSGEHYKTAKQKKRGSK